jgi:hypothetical protein
MQQLQPLLHDLKQKLAAHPLFQAMKTAQPDLQKALSFAPPAVFWVLAFQDVIRLNAKRATTPEIKALLEHHAEEDSGHEFWFLDDIRTAYGDMFTNPHTIFTPETLEVREMAYSIVAESLSLTDDKLRLIYIELLESTADVFFSKFADFMRTSGHYNRLKYFGTIHWEAESSHEIFEEDRKEQIMSYNLTPAQRAEAETLSIRIFGYFEGLATQIHKHFESKQGNTRGTIRSAFSTPTTI